jgi:hypothetical protein
MRKTRIGIALVALAVAATAFAGIATAASRSTVSIAGSNGEFWGDVESPDEYTCETYRKVKVFKQLGPYQNPKFDLRIATDYATPDGSWAINSDFRHGAFYAKAARIRGYCKAATSPTIVG